MQNRHIARYFFALVTVTAIFGALVVAPITANVEPQMALRFEPGKMPPQQVIAAAAEEAEVYLASLQIEELPEPEPEPIFEPEAIAAVGEAVVLAQPAPPQPVANLEGSREMWMSAAGIDPSNWGYVDFIASKESGWNPSATNPSSGACGLIQAYPCSKVPGNGYDPIDNLRWANGYAVDRYGSWEQAYGFWVQNSWW